MQYSRCQRGFSLVEMVTVIAITGILGGMVAMLIKGPVQGYVDNAQRADMTDVADTISHRLTHDVRLALPNSVRVTGTCDGAGTCYLEYLEMIAGGRYNTDTTACFDTASMVSGGVTCLTTVGDLVGGADGSTSNVLVNGRDTLSASAVLVINNQDNNSSGTCAASSVYCGYGAGYGGVDISGGVVTNSGVQAADDVISFSATLFSPSSSERFQIVDTPVTYVCSPNSTSGTITRYWNYSIQATQPSSTLLSPLSSASSAVLASHVSSCSFAITSIVDASGQSAVLVTMPITISEKNGQSQNDNLTIYGTAYAGSESAVYGGGGGGVP